MILRNLDDQNDWTFGTGKQTYLTQIEALKLNLRTRLRSWNGDCYFALPEGVDWNNYLDIGTKDLLDRDIRRVTLQTEGVLKIYEYQSTLDRDDRALSVEMKIATIYGDLELSEVF